MDIKIVDPEGVEVSKEEKPLISDNSISAHVLPEIELGAIADVLNLDRKTMDKYSSELNLLLEYAKRESPEDKSPENLKWAIRSLELTLGTPPLAEKKITFLARYAYLLQEEFKIKEEKGKFERNGFK